MRNHSLRTIFTGTLALVAAASLAGCAPTTTGDLLTSSSQVSVNGPLVVGASGVFFLNIIGAFTSTPSPNMGLSRIPLAGGAPVLLDPNPPSTDFLAVDDDSLFYGGNDGGPGTSGTITRVAQAGGTPQTLATPPGAMAGMVVSGGKLLWATQTSAAEGTGAVFAQAITPLGQAPATPVAMAQNLMQPCALAADDTSVYWLDCAVDELLSLPLTAAPGAAPRVLATNLNLGAMAQCGDVSLSLAAAGGQVYWIEGVNVRTVLAGGTPLTVASESDWAPAQLLADASEVYWSTASNYCGASGDGPDVNDRSPGLWSAPAGGGSVSQELGQDASPAAVAMDATFLYWAGGSDGQIHRLAR
jgi:hypothetical protein